MKILYYDCFAGISGDMHLGAMIDAGVDPEHLIRELEKLPVGGFKLNITRDIRRGIEGTRVDVQVENEPSHIHSHKPEPGNKDPDENEDEDHAQHHHHHHHHDHDDHEHGHDHDHDYDYDHEHVHRNLHDIEQIVLGSSLNDRVKHRAMKMFMLIARAESKIHGVPVDKIHFHEVGALDSIVDVVGAAICIEYLKPDRILSSSVELGGGMIRCAHGIMPVPAPATAEIVKDIPVILGTTPHEATTPTGAAILAANVDQFTDNVRFSPSRTAYGIGGRDMEIPNVLRVYMAEVDEKGAQAQESVMIACNIDDMNPEWYSHVMEQLFAKGADDVFITPIIMKKTRAAAMLSVLCDGNLEQMMTETILQETTSLGVRSHPVKKHMLEREVVRESTSLGEVTVKKAWYKGRLLKSKVEYDDCRRLANEHKLPIQEVHRIVASETGLRDKLENTGGSV